MDLTRPFHRTVRDLKPSENSGFSSWAYITDSSYAQDGQHFVRSYLIIQRDLENLFEFLEPTDACIDAYSFRTHALLMRTCIEIEANFKAILRENQFAVASKDQNITHYRLIDTSHHLSTYRVNLPIWQGAGRTWIPFERWRPFRGKACPQNCRSEVRLPWYQAYNSSKHDRHESFQTASFGMVIEAVAALLILITAQFRTETFQPVTPSLAVTPKKSGPFKPAIGSLFEVAYPDDWAENELYDFNWSDLQLETSRFSEFDYDSVPY